MHVIPTYRRMSICLVWFLSSHPQHLSVSSPATHYIYICHIL